ncbi:MAG: hypothetical protein M0P11_01035 [Anaerolineaceae bacterium]|nr:hypothetical protein [Anaerolineaceae bacterium]
MFGSVSRKRISLGLQYGFIAGLFFTLAAWGMDAWLLNRHNLSLPFVKFIPALLVCLPASVLAGYLTARFESGVVTLLLWLGLAVLFTYMTLLLPLKFVPWAIGKIEPDYIPLIKIEALNNIGHYWFFGIFAIGCGCVLCGILENLLIDQSLASSSLVGGWMPMFVCLAIMVGTGLSADMLVTSHFREPVAVIDTLLKNGATYYNQEVDKLEARKMHLTVVRPLEDLVLEPYKLTLIASDNYLGVMKVVVEFDTQEALCHVVYSQPTFCEIIKPEFKHIEFYLFETPGKSKVDKIFDDIILASKFSATLTS